MGNTIAIKEITLVQSPIIKHKLQEAGKEVSKRIEDLNIENQVATVDTLKPLKTLRTELNKELTDFEEQRKFIKKAVNTPYNDFEDVYKTEISEKYKYAITILKDKIALVENKIKSNKKEHVESYFKELCVAEKIDFISFEKVGIDINLSTTEKKYKETVFDYVEKIIDDLKLIKSTDFEAETLTEYKGSLNVSSAITTVKKRKEDEATELARLKALAIHERKNYLKEIGMLFVEITNSFEFNEDIHISVSEIETLSQEDYRAKVSKCEAEINDFKYQELQRQPSKNLEVQVLEKPIKNQVIAAPVSAPKIEKKQEPLKTASFEVKATMTQLRALGVYMKGNNITYKNI